MGIQISAITARLSNEAFRIAATVPNSVASKATKRNLLSSTAALQLAENSFRPSRQKAFSSFRQLQFRPSDLAKFKTPAKSLGPRNFLVNLLK